ncbi:MAG: hypothetical protein M1561_03240 [Gammaproteobacteria bacterium]|nr:hypothetical protein [Gammaproteobacteria bacterium]
MEVKHLTKIGFFSLLKFVVSVTLMVGIICGLIAFIIGLFGGPITANVGITHLQGIAAGTVDLILYPIVFILIGIVYSLAAYFPLNLFLKIIKGVKISGDWV